MKEFRAASVRPLMLVLAIIKPCLHELATLQPWTSNPEKQCLAHWSVYRCTFGATPEMVQ